MDLPYKELLLSGFILMAIIGNESYTNKQWQKWSIQNQTNQLKK